MRIPEVSGGAALPAGIDEVTNARVNPVFTNHNDGRLLLRHVSPSVRLSLRRALERTCRNGAREHLTAVR